ncbi:UDP-N-acetylglucosamine 2-epimerase [Methanococcus vannielii SB]|jgi:UDP-N-acetylglucosamine 2-epimerase (non-hydrolysing)|uniref:UDP-N-acetylglucosamine 2-epimerase n=1 Tax=Methanococcus vannielii (strain ATCC 35089 / DSM 1224 / JCM 13029 / OCM 148 / SB) TaxID=406327 RepID=A6UNN6_METVS|nr:UDP-N-acetylglucosamine 2-epimerase (non-hydrolyzing) [Methanococcus vannielii]ABR54108.1 UDP-N-acetylglucosamine 2-epimerase [Methanococcus vannielii SB]
MKIVTIVGARPQFIKLAPVSKEIRKHFEEVIIHTGQHYDFDMDKIFFEELEIPTPDHNLNIGSGTHGFQTGEMLKKIEEILLKEKPDLVLVYGDTNSTIAGALSASKLNIKIAHVEAGLRSFDRKMPEEINRVLTDHISNILFTPTDTADTNLKNEGINTGVFNIGDVMYDSLLNALKLIEKKNFKMLNELNIFKKEYILATVHRAENTDVKENLENIINAFIESDEKIIFPVHPRTRKYLEKYGFLEKIKNCENLKLISPVGYLEMIYLENNAKKILTDSGGVQKEAYFLKVPCVTLRNNTEWVETVLDGWNILVGSNKEKILENISKFNPKTETYNYRFGEGDSSKRIVDVLRNV